MDTTITGVWIGECKNCHRPKKKEILINNKVIAYMAPSLSSISMKKLGVFLPRDSNTPFEGK